MKTWEDLGASPQYVRVRLSLTADTNLCTVLIHKKGIYVSAFVAESFGIYCYFTLFSKIIPSLGAVRPRESMTLLFSIRFTKGESGGLDLSSIKGGCREAKDEVKCGNDYGISRRESGGEGVRRLY